MKYSSLSLTVYKEVVRNCFVVVNFLKFFHLYIASRLLVRQIYNNIIEKTKIIMVTPSNEKVMTKK